MFPNFDIYERERRQPAGGSYCSTEFTITYRIFLSLFPKKRKS